MSIITILSSCWHTFGKSSKVMMMSSQSRRNNILILIIKAINEQFLTNTQEHNYNMKQLIEAIDEITIARCWSRNSSWTSIEVSAQLKITWEVKKITFDFDESDR